MIIGNSKINAAQLAMQAVNSKIESKTNNDLSNSKKMYLYCRKIKEKKWFFNIHFFLVTLSFIIPGILSFYDSDYEFMKRVTNGVTIPLVLLHSGINIVTVLDGMNTVTATWKYLFSWTMYEVVKIGLIIVQLSSYSVQNQSFQLSFAVMLFLICEGIHFFLSEYETPRNIVKVMSKHYKRLFWITFILLLSVYAFSYLGYVLFRDAVHRAHEDNIFIEGNEFDNIIDAMITMLDTKDWFNSYLIRAIEDQIPGSIIYFEVYILIVRCLLENLLLATIIEIFTSPITEKLMLSV